MRTDVLETRKGERERFIQEILDREWAMFQSVNSSAYAPCQNDRKTFQQVRESIFQLWPRKLLAAYLIQLTTAKRTGRNLWTEKYARMDNLIPPINTSPLIEKIVEIETNWQKEISEKYPALYARTCRSTEHSDGGMNFAVYLRCELETYGDAAIEGYYEWVSLGDRAGMNYSLTMLNQIVLKSGFASIDEAEFYWSGGRH